MRYFLLSLLIISHSAAAELSIQEFSIVECEIGLDSHNTKMRVYSADTIDAPKADYEPAAECVNTDGYGVRIHGFAGESLVVADALGGLSMFVVDTFRVVDGVGTYIGRLDFDVSTDCDSGGSHAGLAIRCAHDGLVRDGDVVSARLTTVKEFASGDVAQQIGGGLLVRIP